MYTYAYTYEYTYIGHGAHAKGSAAARAPANARRPESARSPAADQGRRVSCGPQAGLVEYTACLVVCTVYS